MAGSVPMGQGEEQSLRNQKNSAVISNNSTSGKLSIIMSDFLLTSFWAVCSYLFFTIVILGLIPLLFIGGFDMETFLIYTIGQPFTFWLILLTTLPFILIFSLFSSLFKLVPKVVLFLLPVLSFLLSILVFILLKQPCEGLECMGQGFAIWAESSVVIIATSLLTVSYIRSTRNQTGQRIYFHETFRSGLVLLLAFSLLGAITVSPWIAQSREEKAKEEESRTAERTARIEAGERLKNLKEEYSFLKPTYLPNRLEFEHRVEYEKNGSLVIDYTCKLVSFDIQEVPLAKQIDFTTNKLDYEFYTTENIQVSGSDAKIYERYFQNKLDTEDPYYTKKLLERYLVWETNELQIIIKSEDYCLLTKEELIEVAESMKSMK